ncbi:hypothetical protein GO013_16385 [Pseudodesulfovibrio sp. JC047]|uniref:hypothetical protein n=1 Tax=Pseudodesulfovibrio sp. JC047 TaxID=2683199 RepID=UPI0013D634CF|nr:hypothetical protein [Pseudodesulfovibrio sp. JC047]NDV20990.1 hypothetical protein [Pseudodesulfovibrio sp. JC047]
MLRITSLLMFLFLITGCVASVPKEALQLPPESMANRQLQTRRYETGNEGAVLIAANAVLLDLGFNLDESSVELGVVVGSKTRDASDSGQLIMLAILGGLGQNPSLVNAADDIQIVKVSLVVRQLDQDENIPDTDLTLERIKEVQGRVHDALYEGLLESFPKDTCEKVASKIAENTADTLANDLDTLLSVKESPGNTAVRVTFQRVIFNQLGQVNSQHQINDPAVYQEFFEKLSKSLFLEANQI